MTAREHLNAIIARSLVIAHDCYKHKADAKSNDDIHVENIVTLKNIDMINESLEK